MMSWKKPSIWGTLAVLAIAISYLGGAIHETVEHGGSGGFSPLEVGILVTFAVVGVAVVMLGKFHRLTPDQPTKAWDWILGVSIVIAVVAAGVGKLVLERMVFHRPMGLTTAFEISSSFVTGSIFAGWAISRFRKARAVDRTPEPSPTGDL
jgi:hypothetical protein